MNVPFYNLENGDNFKGFMGCPVPASLEQSHLYNLIFYTSIGAMDFHQVFDMVLLVYICFCTRILYPFTQRWRKTCLRRKWLHLFWQIWPDHNQGDLLRAIENKTVGWYGISICLDMFSSQFLGGIGQLHNFFFLVFMIFFPWATLFGSTFYTFELR